MRKIFGFVSFVILGFFFTVSTSVILIDVMAGDGLILKLFEFGNSSSERPLSVVYGALTIGLSIFMLLMTGVKNGLK